MVENWLKLMSIRDIQVFIGFANFYWYFIQGFSRIVTLLILWLKAIGLPNLVLKAFNADDNKIVKVGDKANKTVINLSKNKKSRNLTRISNIRAIK